MDNVISTITVRIRVARSELIPSTPTLAKMAVSAAKTAERKAQSCQELKESGAILVLRHSGAMRQHRTRNLEIPGPRCACSRDDASRQFRSSGSTGSGETSDRKSV